MDNVKKKYKFYLMPNTGIQPQKNSINKDLYKICPSCGNFHVLWDKDIYCCVCGDKFIDKCPNCHEPIIYPTTLFCPACSYKIKKDG